MRPRLPARHSFCGRVLTAALNRDALKLLAAGAMLVDHIGWRFLDFWSAAGQASHSIGRIAMPVLCFFVAEGFARSHSRTRYALRLLLFALLSQLPYALFQSSLGQELRLNAIFTLLFCFLSVLSYEKLVDCPLRWPAVFGCAIATLWCDWPVTAVFFTLSFWVFRANRGRQAAAFLLTAAFYFCLELFAGLAAGASPAKALLASRYTLGALAAPVLLQLYNGQNGRLLQRRWGKQLFYWFYPVHLLVLTLL